MPLAAASMLCVSQDLPDGVETGRAVRVNPLPSSDNDLYTMTWLSIVKTSPADTMPKEALLREIALVARARCTAANVSGCMVYESGFFLQTIEGRREDVLEIYDSFERDVELSPILALHRDWLADRVYSDWAMVSSLPRSRQLNVAGIVANVAARVAEAPHTDPHDHFQKLMMPERVAALTGSRTSLPGVAPPLSTRVALCSNTSLWLNPTFLHLEARFGEPPQTSAITTFEHHRVNATSIEYEDIPGDGYGAARTRIIGVTEALLSSQVANPLLSNVDLIVLLARAREGEDFLAFVGHLLAHRWRGPRKPEMLLIAADSAAAFVPAIRVCAHKQGFNLQVRAGSPQSGDEIWAQVEKCLRATTR